MLGLMVVIIYWRSVMKKSHLVSLGLITGLIFLSSGYVVMAQSPTPVTRQERVQARQEIRQENINNRVEARCDLVNQRIDNRISRFQENFDQVEAGMARVTTRTNDLINRLETKGYDVSQVRSDLVTLEGMRSTRRSLFEAFMAELEATKQYDCGDAQGAFKTALTESREALKTWGDQVKANRDFIRTTLRPDLQALRAQKQDSVVE